MLRPFPVQLESSLNAYGSSESDVLAFHLNDSLELELIALLFRVAIVLPDVLVVQPGNTYFLWAGLR